VRSYLSIAVSIYSPSDPTWGGKDKKADIQVKGEEKGKGKDPFHLKYIEIKESKCQIY